MRSRFLRTGCLALLAIACGEPGPAPAAGVDTLLVSVIDSIGVEIGDSNYVFLGLQGTAWGPDGSIAALDMVRGCVMVYSADGEFLRRIGRRGNGPGELQDIGFLAVTGDGHLYLAGEGNQLLGLHVYDFRSGEWQNSYSLMGPPPTGLEGGPGSLCLFKHLSRDPQNPLQGLVLFGWAGPDSASSDTVWQDTFSVDPADMTSVIEKTWYGYELAAGPDGEVWIAPRSSRTYVVHRWDSSGIELEDIVLDMEPVARTPVEMESEEMLLVMKANAMGFPPGVQVSPDPFRPMIRGLEVDPEGRLWALRGTGEEIFFDIFGADGALEAHARLSRPLPDASTLRFTFGEPGILAWSEDPESGCQRIYILGYPPAPVRD